MESQPDAGCDVRMAVRMTRGHREMLAWLAKRQRRTMNSVIRVAIERVYEAERMAEIRASGKAQGGSGAAGRS